jgi:uncharacterized protein
MESAMQTDKIDSSTCTNSDNSPAAGGDRLVGIDTLRGVAVLGILVMNIYAFAMPFVAYQNPLAMGGTEWFNLGTWFFTHVFFDQKFLTIFAMLFGGGLIMMSDRAEVRGVSPAPVWYRRNLWLLLIGAAHGYLFWFGDILFHYAFMGLIIYMFRRRTARTLVITASILIAIGLLFAVAGGGFMQNLKSEGVEIQALQSSGETLTEEQTGVLEQWEEMAMFMKPPEQQVSEDVAAYTGGYAEIFSHRLPILVMMQTQATFSFIIWRVGGLMLLGMALMKLGILSGSRSDEFYRQMMLIGYGLGLPLTVFSAWFLYSHQWDMLWSFQVGGIPNYFGSILVAFGHIGLVMTIVRRGIWHSIMSRFSAVGRMAFTNYLMHSVVMTTVFYGYGFGLYGQVPRIWQMAFVAAMLGFQLWFSSYWLSRYHFGPMEWLWRSLTYWRPQPMRKLEVA